MQRIPTAEERELLKVSLEKFGTYVLEKARLRDLEKPISKNIVENWLDVMIESGDVHVTVKEDNFISSQLTLRLLGEISNSTEEFIKTLIAIAVEYNRAKSKHPNWPTDTVYAAAIVGEEAGELIRAAVQANMEMGKVSEMNVEAIQTAAMCVRFVTKEGIPTTVEEFNNRGSWEIKS